MDQKNFYGFNNCVIGIEASRIRSGGGKAHLVGILTAEDPMKYGISEVHLWSYQALLKTIPNRPWLFKHNPDILERSLFHQVYWQRFQLPKVLQKTGCSIVFNTSAGTVSRFQPSVTLSQQMLCYQPKEMWRYGISKLFFRLVLLRYLKNISFRRSSAVIFLTKYAADSIQKYCGQLSQIAYIPHGVGIDFKSIERKKSWPIVMKNPFSVCIFLTPMYTNING